MPAVGVDPGPVDPALPGSVEIRQGLAVEAEELNLRLGQGEQGHADGGLVFQLLGQSLGVGADHPAAAAPQPVLGSDGLLQQGHEPLQIAGIGAGAEDQAKVRRTPLTGLSELLCQIGDGGFEGGFAAQCRGALRLLRRLSPGQQRREASGPSHRRTLQPLDNDH